MAKNVPDILNVGIIGFGVSGKYFHAPFIHKSPFFKLLKIVTSRKEEVEKLYPYAGTENEVNELFNDSNIDIVIVTSPNTFHFDHVRKALLAGKHVIVEKPFTPKSAEAEELIQLARKKNRILSVYHNRRWDGDYLTIKKIIENRLLGRVVEFESHFDRYRPEYDPSKWRHENKPGGGVFFDLGTHLIDQAVCLFGNPLNVWADLRIQREIGEVDDAFEIHLGYEGIKVILKGSIMVREPGPRFIIHGTKGSYIKYGMDPQEALLRKGYMPVENELGKEESGMYGKINTSVQGLHFIGNLETIPGDYMEYFNNFYRAILGKEKLQVMPQEAKLVIEIIEKAFESNTKKQIIAI